MSTPLSEDLKQFIHDQVASGHYASEDEVLEQAVRMLKDRAEGEGLEGKKDIRRRVEAEDQSSDVPKRKPIWEVAIERMSIVPDDELERLPADGAEQLDHYLYGTPKRSS